MVMVCWKSDVTMHRSDAITSTWCHDDAQMQHNNETDVCDVMLYQCSNKYTRNVTHANAAIRKSPKQLESGQHLFNLRWRLTISTILGAPSQSQNSYLEYALISIEHLIRCPQLYECLYSIVSSSSKLNHQPWNLSQLYRQTRKGIYYYVYVYDDVLHSRSTWSLQTRW
jgi:hypothetical protein